MSEKLLPVSLSPEQAAQVLGVTRTRVYVAIKSGELKSYKDGRRRLVSREAIREYVATKDGRSPA